MCSISVVFLMIAQNNATFFKGDFTLGGISALRKRFLSDIVAN